MGLIFRVIGMYLLAGIFACFGELIALGIYRKSKKTNIKNKLKSIIVKLKNIKK